MIHAISSFAKTAFAIMLIMFGVYCAPAHSITTTYSYTGSNYINILDSSAVPGSYTTSMNITGSFTLGDALLPNLLNQDISSSLIDFSFNDGRFTLTPANTTIFEHFQVSTDSSGNISDWWISIFDKDLGSLVAGEFAHHISTSMTLNRGHIYTCEIVSGSCVTGAAYTDRGEWSGEITGIWTAAETPIPAALPLFATGAGIIGLLGWRRKRRKAKAT